MACTGGKGRAGGRARRPPLPPAGHGGKIGFVLCNKKGASRSEGRGMARRACACQAAGGIQNWGCVFIQDGWRHTRRDNAQVSRRAECIFFLGGLQAGFFYALCTRRRALEQSCARKNAGAQRGRSAGLGWGGHPMYIWRLPRGSGLVGSRGVVGAVHWWGAASGWVGWLASYLLRATPHHCGSCVAA
jgi:hypothetical protein